MESKILARKLGEKNCKGCFHYVKSGTNDGFGPYDSFCGYYSFLIKKEYKEKNIKINLYELCTISGERRKKAGKNRICIENNTKGTCKYFNKK